MSGGDFNSVPIWHCLWQSRIGVGASDIAVSTYEFVLAAVPQSGGQIIYEVVRNVGIPAGIGLTGSVIVCKKAASC